MTEVLLKWLLYLISGATGFCGFAYLVIWGSSIILLQIQKSKYSTEDVLRFRKEINGFLVRAYGFLGSAIGIFAVGYLILGLVI
jgi:hypothetical protein